MLGRGASFALEHEQRLRGGSPMMSFMIGEIGSKDGLARISARLRQST
jgi:hypothetical protein